MSGSKAFAGQGTLSFIDGVEIVEVTGIAIGRKLQISANYIPASYGHRKILAAILGMRPVTISIYVPVANYHESFTGIIDGVIKFPVFDIVRISFEMNLVRDPAEDGIEVPLIRFLTRFPKGTSKGFKIWQAICERVNPWLLN